MTGRCYNSLKTLPLPIIIVTTNPSKIKRFKYFIDQWAWNSGVHVQVYTLSDLGIKNFDCPEIYYDYKANAALKADMAFWCMNEDPNTTDECKEIIRKHHVIIADDSGLEIPMLNGWPGVKTKRCGDAEHKTSAEMILRRVQNELPEEDRWGYMHSAIYVRNVLFDCNMNRRDKATYGAGVQKVSIGKSTSDLDPIETAWDVCSPYKKFDDGYCETHCTYSNTDIPTSMLYDDYMWQAFKCAMQYTADIRKEYLDNFYNIEDDEDKSKVTTSSDDYL